MLSLLAFADVAALGTVALSSLAAFFAYLTGRDKLKFDAKVVLLEKTVADNAADMAETKERLTTVEGEYKECEKDRRDLRDKVNALESREVARHGSIHPLDAF